MPDHQTEFLKRLFEAAVRRADPRGAVPLPLPLSGAPATGRTVVVGAGKASAAFAQALKSTMEQLDRKIGEGFVICPHGSSLNAGPITCFEASHPIPDQRSLEGARHILNLASELGADDELIVLLSGGGSSLMALPLEGISLEEKRALTDQLLKCGASIQEINCVRTHLSQIKGGKLAQAAWPARVTTLAISDVVGNDPSTIASGPTVEGTSTPQDAAAILARYNLLIPASVAATLTSSGPKVNGASRTSGGEDHYQIIATPEDAIEQAASEAREFGPVGLQIHNQGCALEGSAQDMARAHASLALELKKRGGTHLILSGGELTCQLPPALDFETSKGGPNHVYILTLLHQLKGEPCIYALAADTDGKDGSTSAAGAFIGPEDWQRALDRECDPEAALATHKSGTFFDRLGNQLVTGPTHTNVNDFRAILITESRANEPSQ